MCYYNSTHPGYVIKVLNSPIHIALHTAEKYLYLPVFVENLGACKLRPGFFGF